MLNRSFRPRPGLTLARLSLFLLFGLLPFGGAALAQVSWSDAGNGMLNGTFHFREVIMEKGADGADALANAFAHYGTITFDGNGRYSVNASIWGSTAQATVPAVFGDTYFIGESGYGFLNRAGNLGGRIYGLVAGDVFLGSSTEIGGNSLFVAVRAAGTTVESFGQVYSTAYTSFEADSLSGTRDAMFELAPNGAGGFATINLEGYIGGDYTATQQTIGGAKYSFTDGIGTLNLQGIVLGKNLMSGIKEFYVSPDGRFIFGGSKTKADFFIGINKPASGVPTNALDGQYFHAGLEVNRSHLPSNPPVQDTFYGAFSVNSGVLLGHQRLREASVASAYDYSWSEEVTIAPSGEVNDTFDYSHVVAADGRFRIGFGRGDYIGIWVAVKIPSSTGAGNGPYITPVGVLNAGSFSPFTSGLARGTVVTAFGINFASEVFVDGTFPVTLGGVSVRVNGLDARIYVVAPNQVSFVLPYNLGGGIAEIQVFRNGTASNRITSWLNKTSAGVFTVPPTGVGYAAALHADFTLVTTDNPAMPGETIQIYLTGLGIVDPSVTAGDPGPVNPLSWTTETLAVWIGDHEAAISFSGLAPFLGSLYQLNVTVSPDQEPGDWSLFISGPDSYGGQALVPVGGTGPQIGPTAHKARSKTRRKTGAGTTGSPRR